MAKDPIEGQVVETREAAERLSKILGCSGAHQMEGGWGPCPSHEHLLVLIRRGAPGYRRWLAKRNMKNKKSLASEDQKGVAIVGIIDQGAADAVYRDDGGVSADDYHVTVAFLGKMDTVDVSADDLVTVVQRVAKRFGEIEGEFTHSTYMGEKDDVLAYEIKSTELHHLHDVLTGALDTYDVKWSNRFLYRPHVSVGKYRGRKMPMREGPLKKSIPLRISALEIWFGRERTLVPLGGPDVSRERFVVGDDGKFIPMEDCSSCDDTTEVKQFSVDAKALRKRKRVNNRRTFRDRGAAEDYAAQIGCEGAHEVGDGVWAPCIDDYTLQWANPKPERAGHRRRTVLDLNGRESGGTV